MVRNAKIRDAEEKKIGEKMEAKAFKAYGNI